jgi:hypothetical protein
MKPEPATAHHVWLHQLLGNWTYEGTASTGPGKPDVTWSGRETVQSLGDLWTIAHMTGGLPGGGVMEARVTLGYDPKADRFRGTFLASTSAHLWVYEGTRDGDVLTLNCRGPSFLDPDAMADYQDIIEILAPDRRRLRSRVRNDDGTWIDFMSSEYRREG